MALGLSNFRAYLRNLMIRQTLPSCRLALLNRGTPQAPMKLKSSRQTLEENWNIPMDGINPRQASHDPTTLAADTETSSTTETARNERRMMCGMGRSGGLMTMAIVAVAVVVIAGLSFGWSGWLTASLGGISLLFLLPCLAMCIGMIWMMMRGSNGQPSK